MQRGPMRTARKIAFVMAVIGVATVALASCGPLLHQGLIRPGVPLVVTNQSEMDVVVYALPSEDDPGIRVGTVKAVSTRTLLVPYNALALGEMLVVRLNAVGSTAVWTSGSMWVGGETKAKLDVAADAMGEFERCALHEDL